MSVPALLADLASHGIQVAVNGDRLQYWPRSAATGELVARMLQYKQELLRVLSPSESPRTRTDKTDKTPAGNDCDDFDAANEFYWTQLTDEDRDYLLGPRDRPADPCSWCGGWLTHADSCNRLRREWALATPLPWGKHRGRPVADVPVDYLRWLLQRDLRSDLREAIKQRLREAIGERIEK